MTAHLQTRTACSLLFLASALASGGCKGGGSTPPPGPPPAVPTGVEPVPELLRAMDAAEPTRRIYVSADRACADDGLNDGSVEACDGRAGPFRGLAELMASRPAIEPGTAVVLREGTYPVRNISLEFSGTPEAPIFLMAYPGESPSIDGGFHREPGTYADRIALIVSGSNVVVRGLTFVGCHRTCALIVGENVVVSDSAFTAGEEDALKTSFGNRNVLITRNRFTHPSTSDPTPSTPEAIDGFQATRVWVIDNEFTDSDTDLGGWGVVAWFKAGASEVYFQGNRVHDVRVTLAGAILGGCCFNNWDWEPDTPVARQVVFADNVFERVTFASDVRSRGTILSQGCHGCAAYDNVLSECEAGLSVQPTDPDGEPVPEATQLSTAVTFARNQVDVVGSAPLAAVRRGVEVTIDENRYTCASPSFLLDGEELDLAAWRAAGFDASSQVCE